MASQRLGARAGRGGLLLNNPVTALFRLGEFELILLALVVILFIVLELWVRYAKGHSYLNGPETHPYAVLRTVCSLSFRCRAV